MCMCMSAGFTASAAFTASFWEGFGSLGPKPGGGILGVEKAVDQCTSTGRSQDADGRWRELSQCVRMQPVKTKRGRSAHWQRGRQSVRGGTRRPPGAPGWLPFPASRRWSRRRIPPHWPSLPGSAPCAFDSTLPFATSPKLDIVGASLLCCRRSRHLLRT